MTLKLAQFCDDPQKISTKCSYLPKIFIFLKNPKNIEIQNFEPKKSPSLRKCENIRVPPLGAGPPPPPNTHTQQPTRASLQAINDSMLGHHRPASKCCLAGGSMMAHFKWYLNPLSFSPHQLKTHTKNVRVGPAHIKYQYMREFFRDDKNSMGCFVQGGKSLWDVLSGVSKNGMGCFVLGCFVRLPPRYVQFTFPDRS